MTTSAAGGGNGGTNLLARTALAGAAFFAAYVLLLPIFSEYTLAGDYISELAIGRFGFVQTLAFLAFGIGSLALAVGLRRATKGSWGSVVGSVLFGLFGVGVVVDAIFPIDRGGMQPETVAGTVHILAALVAFVCAILAMFVLTRTFKQDAGWQPHWRLSAALATVALVAFFLPSDGAWAGIFQRLFVGITIAWMVLTAGGLRSTSRKASFQQQARVR
ncbi:MAG: hypothetical protein AVDCRST_MAG22-3515 [uncultured Rubrobacteraceae bacterium]|uniref:DUF998 domain-containing protein n=1 Tax=uncultured Rubrobacteraceae bacterium TaxID=349277 RepID=A0A6J4Q9H6_9ACTN|nr:MAG: hypothetical protein AVDCRST_MAG22-3515 [uncultured Rubrobacteraceae bacterium]